MPSVSLWLVSCPLYRTWVSSSTAHSLKRKHLWVDNESWEALGESLLVLVLGVLGESWGAGGLEEGGLADAALDVHSLDVLCRLLALIHESAKFLSPSSWQAIKVLSALSCLVASQQDRSDVYTNEHNE